MKKHLFILMAFVVCSCEVIEPKTYTFNIKATYETYSYYGPGNVVKYVLSDKGAIVYVFNNINVLQTDYKFDGNGNMTSVSLSKTVKYDQKISLDDGFKQVTFREGLYTFACVSNHSTIISSNPLIHGKPNFMYLSSDVGGDYDDITFDFK